jgi:hypothetical protein
MQILMASILLFTLNLRAHQTKCADSLNSEFTLELQRRLDQEVTLTNPLAPSPDSLIKTNGNARNILANMKEFSLQLQELISAKGFSIEDVRDLGKELEEMTQYLDKVEGIAPEILDRAIFMFERIAGDLMYDHKGSITHKLEGWRQEVQGEIGELTVAFLAPSASLKKNEKVRSQEIDIFYRENGTIILTEIKNYKSPFRIKDIERLEREDPEFSILSQIQFLAQLANGMNDGVPVMAQVVFVNGITNHAEKLLFERYGPNIRFRSGVQLR